MDVIHPATRVMPTTSGPLGRSRRGLIRLWALDAGLAAGFLTLLLIERVNAAGRIGDRMPTAIALAAVIVGALAARRRTPLTAYLISSAAMLVEARFVFVSAVTPNANLIAVYSLGLYATRRRAWWGPVMVVAGNIVYFSSIHSLSGTAVAGPLVLWLLAWAFGYGNARRQEEREAARLVLRDRVVADERAHIARELHDLVGHSLNVMLVQAGAARRVLDRDPQQTWELLTSLESTGREAFEELDRVLGLLRPSNGTWLPGSVPTGESELHPGLADLARLTDRIRQAGIRITMHIDTAGHDVPRSVDMSAYRIVQEALTNTVKHSRAGSADVTVVHRGQLLDIEVCDDGRGAVDGYAIGRGLSGINERVSMFGGLVEHGGRERRRRSHKRRRHRGRRTGLRWPPGGRVLPNCRAGRRLDGRPDAGDRRHRSHPANRRGGLDRPGPGTHHVPPRRVRLGGASGRCQRIPAQASLARATDRRRAHPRRRRRFARPGCHPRPRRTVRRPQPAPGTRPWIGDWHS
jgi:signal transduction histidine kinase